MNNSIENKDYNEELSYVIIPSECTHSVVEYMLGHAEDGRRVVVKVCRLCHEILEAILIYSHANKLIYGMSIA